MILSPFRTTLVIVMLWAAGLGAAAQFGKISVLYETLVQHYDGPGRVALMVSVVGMVGLIFGTTAGILVQRLGMRRVLLVALVLGAALSAVQALLPAYPLMMLSRVLEGVSHLAIVVVGPVLIAQTAPLRHQGLAMTLWSSFFGVSLAVLALIAPGLLRLGGEAAVFLFHAGFMLAVAAVLAVLLPPIPAQAAPAGEPGDGLLRQHVAIYRSPRIAAPATGFFFYTILYVALITLLPPIMEGQKLLAAMTMPLISILVSLTFGVWMLGRVSAVVLVQLGFAIAFVAGVALWLGWESPVFRLAAALALAAALGIVQGASFASIPQLNASGRDRAEASGAIAQLGNLGTTTGTPILAGLIAAFGLAGLVGFILPLCAGGIVIHAWQARRRRRQA